MNVGQLIKKLQKLDKSLPVYIAAHDNSEHEMQGKIESVCLLSKDDDHVYHESHDNLDSMPTKWVTLR